MIGKRYEIASLQSDFYRQQFHKLLRLLMGSFVIIFILLSLIIYFILFRPPQNYYANTVDGKVFPMPVPLKNRT